MSRTEKKRARQERLVQELGKNPFLKDEEIAKKLKVSVATIRLDRAELGIREYRERIRGVAEHTADGNVDCGEVLDFNLFRDGISILNTLDSTVFEGGNVVKGQAMYAYAENLALSVINARSALVRIANIKYIKEVIRGDRLIAKYEVIRVQNNEYVVWVKMKRDMTEVFRAKFNLSVTDERN